MQERISATDLQELKLAHKRTKDKRIADRYKAVLMRISGLEWAEIAEYLLLDDTTIRKYYNIYETEGIDGLETWNYQGRPSKLTENQKIELSKHLEAHCYQRAEEIIAYIQDVYQVTYSKDGVTKLIKNLGFVYKKFSDVPCQADAEKQAEFIKKYNDIKQAKKEDEVIVFSDATHPNLQTELGRGWIKKGQEKIIPSASGRQRLNILGAINLEEKDKPLIKTYNTINNEAVIDFIEILEKKYPDASKIIFICDNARYYHSKEVKKRLTKSRVEFVFLPSYSPNLNPIERFWRFLKQYGLKNRFFPDLDSFRQGCFDFLDNLKAYNHKLDSWVSDNFSPIDASNVFPIFE